MKLSRQSFLKASGAALVGHGLTGLPSFATVLEPWAAAPATGAALFRPHVNTTFTFHGDDGPPVRMVLARVVEPRVDVRVEQFSLVLVATDDSAPPAGIYRLQHPAMDPFDLFIAPVGGPGAPRQACEACFSRCRERRARDQAWPTSS